MSTLQPPNSSSTSGHTPLRSSSPENGRKASADSNVLVRKDRSGSVTSWKGSARESFSVGMNLADSMATANSSTVSIHEPGSSKRIPMGQGSSVSLTNKAWEAEVETYLKVCYICFLASTCLIVVQNMYTDIKSSQILQPTNGGLSPGNTLGRGASVRRQGGDRIATLKRGSIRGIGVLINQQAVNSSSSSIDGRISPSPSFATSLNDGMSASSSTLFTPALGFASNLTNTIIREAHEDDTRSAKSDASDSTSVSISDEELALLGAPWAKEGMLSRKLYMETTGRKAKHKTWMDVFVVIQKGQLNMFTFGDTGGGGGGGVVGGGNWLSNANSVGEYMLAHSLAHILPPPGYSRRPNVFVLTLATGTAFFFQAGTEELANEWVSTCNYWAARQSKEPLSGGVSNMEYGWSRVEDEGWSDSMSGMESPVDSMSRPSTAKDRGSDTFSIRSGRSRLGGVGGFSTLKASSFASAAGTLADRIYINDWRAPMHSTVASNNDEEGQLEALQKQTERLKTDMKKHRDLQAPMLALVCPVIRSSDFMCLH